MVNVRYRSAADLGPKPPEATIPPAGEPPSVAVEPPVAPTDWTPALLVTAGLLAGFAFLLGSARIINADVWLTLAIGRLVQSGEYRFGVDPFSWASEGAYWANPSWLGSWLFYLAFLTGKATLGIVKGAIVLFLAGILFRTRPRNASLLLTMALTALALLAASPRFIAQTTLFSFLGIAVLLWLLVRDGQLGGDRAGRRLAWFLPLLFLVWSNLDGYYVLGLYILIATAGCRLLDAEGRAEGIRLVLVAAASVVVCMLNPHLTANFMLPPDLSYLLGIGDGGRALSILQAKEPSTFGLISPLSTNYMSWHNFGWNVAGLSFYLLMLFNIGSFLGAAGVSIRLPGLAARAAIAGGLGLLALFQWRFIPFYALVAGPITLLNTVDAFRARAPMAPFKRKVSVVGLAAALALGIFLAWPGWLHMGLGDIGSDRMFQAARRVDWELHPDPSLHKAALALGEQQKKGTAQRVFQASLDLPAYCAFFAPAVKCGIDSRFDLFAKIAPDYAKLRENLVIYSPGDPEVAEAVGDWRIDHVALTNWQVLAKERTRGTGEKMLSDSKRWRLDYADGRTLIFRWSANAAWTGTEILDDWNREAFAPSADEELPADKPADWAMESSWWDLYFAGMGPVPLPADTARLQQYCFQHVIRSWHVTMAPAWELGLLAPAAGVGFAPGNACPALVFAGACEGKMWLRAAAAVDYGPPALPILMERNVRRALLENPHHPFVRELQVDALSTLITEEAYWIRRNSNRTSRVHARATERIAALQDTLVLSPDNPLRRRELALALLDMHLFDASLEQFDLALRGISDLSGPNAAEVAKRLRAEREQLAAEVEHRRQDYELKSAGVTNPMVKVKLAMFDPYTTVDAKNNTTVDRQGRGLVLEALRILHQADPASLSPQDRLFRTVSLMQLNLRMGRVAEAANVLARADAEMRNVPPNLLEEPKEEMYLAAGWYKNLDQTLDAIEKQVAAQNTAMEQIAAMELISRILYTAVNDRMLLPGRLFFRMEFELKRFEMQRAPIPSRMMLSDIETLRGIFLLEQGDAAGALKQFDQATSTDAPFADRPIAERYRDLLRRHAK